jgi:glutamate/aspartate transport system substrate-binding protein
MRFTSATTTPLALTLIAAMATGLAASGASAEPDGRLEKIRASHTITLGFPENSPPFGYRDNQHEPDGYSVAICRQIVERLKSAAGIPDLAIRFNPTTSATRIPLLANNTIDLECGTTTNLPDRHKLASFAPTTFVAQVVLVARKDSGLDVNDVTTFRGKTVAAQAGGQTFRLISQLSAKSNLDIAAMPAKDAEIAFLAVETGRAQGLISDDALAYASVARSKTPDQFAIATKGLEIAPYGILEPKDDDAFKAVVDKAVLEMIKDGTIARLYQTYFTTPALPNNVNLNFPMSAALKHALDNPTDSGDPSLYVQ